MATLTARMPKLPVEQRLQLLSETFPLMQVPSLQVGFAVQLCTRPLELKFPPHVLQLLTPGSGYVRSRSHLVAHPTYHVPLPAAYSSYPLP